MDSLSPLETLTPDPIPAENSDLGAETLAQAESNAGANTPFTAGDFVWAKVTGHPWWPALVSSGTKDDSVLVACFGDDEALAWCEPKQLKPFLKVFDEMSKQSGSKSFLRALYSCVEEIERSLELELTCHCVPVEAWSKPLGGEASRELPVVNFLPEEFQERVMEVAVNVQAVNPLEAARLRSWVFGFGKVLIQGDSWVFHRRRGIEDLVDKIDLDAFPLEMVTGKEDEEDDLTVEVSFGKRRRRSMSKLISEMDLDSVEVDEDDKEEQSFRSKRRKSKVKVEVMKAEEEAGSSSGRRDRKKSKYLSPPYTNLREVGKFLAMLPRKTCSFSDHGTTGSSANNDEEDDNRSNLQKIERVPALELLSEFLSTAENPLHLKGNRAAKVVKFFFTIYRDSFYSDGADFEDYQKLVLEAIAKTEDAAEDSENCEHTTRSGNNVGAFKGTDLDVKQKKSSTKPESDQEAMLDFELQKKNHKNGDHLKYKQRNNDRLEKQKPRRKKLFKDGTNQSAPISADSFNPGAFDSEKEKQKSGNTVDGTSHGSEFVSDLNPADASFNGKDKKKTRRKILKDATSKRATNLDLNMADSLGESKRRKGKKRSKNDANGESAVIVGLRFEGGSENVGSLAIEPINCQEQVLVNEKMAGSLEDANGKGFQKLYCADSRLAELAKSVLKKKNSSSQPKGKSGKKAKGVNPVFARQAALHLTFSEGVDLPSAEDLITTYSKYGALIHPQVELFQESNSARVEFANAVDAENAFKDKAGPYGSVATYRLHYLSDNLISPSETNHDSASPLHITDISPLQQSDLKSPVPKPPLPYIRKSLETMISTLAWPSSSPVNNTGLASDGLKPEARDNLVGEMQGLLQKVDKMLNGAGPSSST